MPPGSLVSTRELRHLVGRALRARQGPSLTELLPRRVTREGLVWKHHIREGRFQRSLALIVAGSAALGGLEVAYEHYRGSYGNRVMYSPVLLTPPLIAAGIWTALSPRATRWGLPATSLLSLGDGLIGLLFHIRGIARKPGGWRLPVFNLVMGPPLLAPVLFAIPGYLGLVASYLRREDDPRGRFSPWTRKRRRRFTLRSELREGRFQKHMAAAAAASAVFSGFEALYSHYKNNFRYPAQWTPVVIAPMLAAAGIGAIFSRRVAHKVLPAVSMLAIANGGIGFFYHARGVLRRPGGTRNFGYNVMYGPPIFAPLLYAASGFLGLLASLLRRERT